MLFKTQGNYESLSIPRKFSSRHKRKLKQIKCFVIYTVTWLPVTPVTVCLDFRGAWGTWISGSSVVSWGHQSVTKI